MCRSNASGLWFLEGMPISVTISITLQPTCSPFPVDSSCPAINSRVRCDAAGPSLRPRGQIRQLTPLPAASPSPHLNHDACISQRLRRGDGRVRRMREGALGAAPVHREGPRLARRPHPTPKRAVRVHMAMSVTMHAPRARIHLASRCLALSSFEETGVFWCF